MVGHKATLPNHLQSRTLARAHARTHTLAPSNLPLLQAPVEGFYWHLLQFGRCIRFAVLHGCETPPLEAHSQPKVTRSEIRRVRWLGDDTTSDVWLGAETTFPATRRASSSELHRITYAKLARANDQ
jgi:hypothetical protein